MKTACFVLMLLLTQGVYAQKDTSNVLNVSDLGDRMQISLGDSVIEFTYEEMYYYYLEKGVELANEADFQTAISYFELSLLYLTTDAQAWYNLGLCYYNLEAYEEAVLNFDQAVSLDPAFSEAYNQRAICKALQGNYEASLPDFQKAIDLNPGVGMNYHNKAVAHLQLGETNLACDLLHQALSLGYENSAHLIEEYCSAD